MNYIYEPEPSAWLVPSVVDFSNAAHVHFSRVDGCVLTDAELMAKLAGTIQWSAEIFHDNDLPIVDKNGVEYSAIPLYARIITERTEP